MIQKLQTYLTRFINWLESNSETRFICSVLRSNEDIELNRLYKEINHLRDRLRILIDKFTNDSLAYERAINHAYSHIKRKQKFLKLPTHELANIMENELRVATSKDAIIVANRLKKTLEKTKTYYNKTAEQIAQDTDAEMLCNIVLSVHKDVNTIEADTIYIKE